MSSSVSESGSDWDAAVLVASDFGLADATVVVTIDDGSFGNFIAGSIADSTACSLNDGCAAGTDVDFGDDVVSVNVLNAFPVPNSSASIPYTLVAAKSKEFIVYGI